MGSTTGDERRIQEPEVKVLGALNFSLNLYFETRRREVEENKEALRPDLRRTKWCGGAWQKSRRNTWSSGVARQNFRWRLWTPFVGDGGASDLAEGVSELQQEIHDLAEAERAALKRKEEAEESLRRVEPEHGGDLGEAADRVAAFALQEALRD